MEKKKRNLIAVITVLLVSGFLATSLISYFVAQTSLRKQMSETTLPLTSDNIYSEIQRDLLRPIFISSLMAQDTFLRDWVLNGEKDEQQVNRYLASIQKRYGTVTSYFVSDKTRRYFHPTGILKTVKEGDPGDQWYFRVRAMKDDYEINLDRDTADRNRLTVFINYRVYDYAGEFIGSAGVGLAIDAVKGLVDAYEKRYGRRILFVDREGQVTLHGETYRGPDNIRQRPGMGAISTQILTSTGGDFTYERDGQTMFVNSRAVPEFKWLLLVEQDGADGEKGILTTLLINVLVAAAITALVLFVAHLTFGAYQRRLEEMASKDKLTGALNRQVFDSLLRRAMTLADREKGKLSLAMLDIDHFKNINDTHGHLAGDIILSGVVDVIRRTVRESDVICRWGGEEFLLLFENCDLEQARALAEKIRTEVEKHSFPLRGGRVTVTVSLGVALYGPGESERDFLSRVDGALITAKRSGRNRSEVAA
ncbi:MAG: diguanylate cyclase [Rhodospirillales bacterium]|nr:diguanylate cyclase [Alphaproteobacteria bacterium]MBL6948244.1 diguanylate cyclase [Rhodospirillales bacterium]